MFNPGDRVVIHGLRETRHLNGRYGVVARVGEDSVIVDVDGEPYPVQMSWENIACLPTMNGYSSAGSMTGSVRRLPPSLGSRDRPPPLPIPQRTLAPPVAVPGFGPPPMRGASSLTAPGAVSAGPYGQAWRGGGNADDVFGLRSSGNRDVSQPLLGGELLYDEEQQTYSRPVALATGAGVVVFVLWLLGFWGIVEKIFDAVGELIEDPIMLAAAAVGCYYLYQKVTAGLAAQREQAQHRRLQQQGRRHSDQENLVRQPPRSAPPPRDRSPRPALKGQLRPPTDDDIEVLT